MTIAPPDLKYLFFAVYRDGTEFRQTPDDVSMTDPTKSAYFDVQQNEVERFGFRGQGKEYWVDIPTKTISIDDVKVTMSLDGPCKHVYFRRNYIDVSTGERRVGYHLGLEFGKSKISFEVF